MQILIACAKIMTGKAPKLIPSCTEPAFQAHANQHAIQLSQYSVEQLMEMMHTSHQIARKNWMRYQHFFDNNTREPAVFSYDGMVFRKLAPETMSDDDLHYANGHLLIGSFLYGLLRPLDLVNKYRLKGNIELPDNGGNTMFDYWRPILTDWFIQKVKADDGILVNLASNELKELFDWKRVKKELTIITPDFKVEKGGQLKTIVIYTKMCRGAMTHWILQKRINDIEFLKAFENDGFRWEKDWLFTLR